MSTDSLDNLHILRALAARRRRLATWLSLAMIAVYFGFIALVAFAPASLAVLVTTGLSRGILLGALVIVAAWSLTFVYVRWANSVYDTELNQLREKPLVSVSKTPAAVAALERGTHS